MGKNFQGLPQHIETIGDVYPIFYNDYPRFKKLAYKYMMYSYEFLKNKLKITNENIKLFDYVMAYVLNEPDQKEREKMQEELDELFSMILRREVKGYFRHKHNDFVFLTDDKKCYIDRNNYDTLRTVVFEQNLLFDQIFAPNEFSQKIIDNAIEVMSKGGENVDIEAMEVFFVSFMNIHPSEMKNYTYYQVRALCELEMRKQMNLIVHLYRSQGGKAEPINLLDVLNIHTNPYGKDKLFKKVSKSEDDKMNKMLGN